MFLKPGSIEWAVQAVRNSQQACQRASGVFMAHGMQKEAIQANRIREASEELANHVEGKDEPEPRSAA